ncbi:PREDICTED: umecyanin-like [Populus euphratica]|uniref:Umecyanin-like n=1 Tax=Populus euphratica TaxID=75702 RepID=A0AAJ6U0M2_POPEU|nr:PREDICTED: umecyanin-like [Populus euphratica]
MRSLIVFVVLGAVSLLLRGSEAADHQVGDTTGWTRPTSTSFYSDWVSGKTFALGDTLTFTFTTGVHDVATVSKSDYDNCNTGSPNSVVTTGPAKITLNVTGDSYFLCTFAGHCSAGQKLAINVPAGNTPSPGTSPETPFSPPPPPPPSAASSLVATFALMFVSIAISLMCCF